MQSDDLTREQHDISEIEDPKNDETLTPEDQDDRVIEGEIGDVDELHRRAFGDEGNLPIDKEVEKDEIARVKGLKARQQKKTS